MKRAAPLLAFLSTAILGCGVDDAGRWVVDTSLRSAYGCSPLVSSDQSAVAAGDVAMRPAPLLVRDPQVVLARAASGPIGPPAPAERTESISIAAIPISRDLGSICAPGTRPSRTVVRMAALPRERFHLHVRQRFPERRFELPVCPTGRG